MKLGIVVPCYNEQEVLPETASRLLALLQRLIDAEKIEQESRIYFVDDGSQDNTWKLIETLGQQNEHIGGIKLSRNHGHQNALLAGLFTVQEDALVSIDADLQDDVDVIERMVDEHASGNHVVYGVRESRRTDTAFKRWTGQAFYRLMRLLGVELVFDHSDCRLMSRQAIEALKQFREVNVFLRGLVPLVGLRSSIVYYERSKRYAGLSKYSLPRMIAFALEGVTSFSIAPLRIITILGLLVFLFSAVMITYVVSIKWFSGRAVPGWASSVVPIYLLGGIQILCIGVIGEYLGKVYKESKARPRYIVEKSFNL